MCFCYSTHCRLPSLLIILFGTVSIVIGSMAPPTQPNLEMAVKALTTDIKMHQSSNNVSDKAITEPTNVIEPETIITPPPKEPNGVIGAIRGWIGLIPLTPGDAIETGVNTTRFLVGLLPLPNVTEVIEDAVDGVQKRPLHTVVSGFSNLIFCNPALAGINYGRCYAWFQTRDNEEFIRLTKIQNQLEAQKQIINGESGKEEGNNSRRFGILQFFGF